MEERALGVTNGVACQARAGIFATPMQKIAFVACLALACHTPAGDPCQRFFSPYRDLVSSRARTALNAPYLDAMALYSTGDYSGAANGLSAYLDTPGADKTAYLYLGVSQLALGKAYDAELSIDHLETSNVSGYTDPCEWYTVLCWLCSGQRDRALEGARAIASGRHTYQREAQDLVEQLEEAP